jgi:hypothetical protein
MCGLMMFAFGKLKHIPGDAEVQASSRVEMLSLTRSGLTNADSLTDPCWRVSKDPVLISKSCTDGSPTARADSSPSSLGFDRD